MESKGSSDYRRISAFIAAANSLPEQAAEDLLKRTFPEGDPLRPRAQSLWERAKRLRQEPDAQQIRPGEPLDVAGYEVLHRIGEGGNGFVHLAKQQNPERLVAIKYLRSTAAGRASARLFDREISNLTKLDHPDIVTVIQGGVTAAGRPYFVMPYVDGRHLSQFVAERTLPLADRLRVFARVCQAVDHAHRKNILHRDLKPANIMVNSEGNPKLIDFGISKLLHPDPEDELASRGFQRQPYTPEYSSPELRKDEPVGTATDVYSLGAVLYQLLTGAPPALNRPVPPSAAVPVEEPRRLGFRDAATLQREYRGDLDAIVMKAIDDLPGGRYRSAGELANDIESYLQGQPVRARAETSAYLFGLFVRRNPVWVAVTAVFLAGLIGLAAAATWQWKRAAVLAAELEVKKNQEAVRANRYQKGGQSLAELTRNLADAQQESEKALYWQLAQEVEKPAGIKLTLVERALALTHPSDPEKAEMEALRKLLAEGSNRGGQVLPKGATNLTLLAIQLELALIHIRAEGGPGEMASLGSSIQAGVPAMGTDAEGANAIRKLVCGQDPDSRTLRESVPEVRLLCK